MKRLLGPLLWIVAKMPAWVDRVATPRPMRRLWLAARFAALSRHPRNFTRRIEPEGVLYAGNTRDVIQRSVRVYGVWEPDISTWMRGFVSEGKTVMDVGANTGYYTLILARLVGRSGHVIAVEPVPSIRADLEANVRRNELDQVEVIGLALGGEEGATEIFRAAASNTGNSGTRWEEGHLSEGSVSVSTGDTVVADRAQDIWLIKIDTEGDEASVLSGMHRTIDAMPSGAAVLVEVTPEKLRQREDSGSDVWAYFATRGWSAHRIRNDYLFSSYGLNRPVELVAVSQLPPSRCDLVFVKP